MKCYAVAETSAVQPFAYLQIVFVSIVGIALHNETLALHVVAGVSLIVAAGIYALLRTRAVEKAT